MLTHNTKPLAASDVTAAADLSVIIVTWNVREDLKRCLDSLLSDGVSRGLRKEIIVVDNASTDGTVEALSNYPVTVIANDANLGYGRANNLGLRAASTPFFLILNPDTIPQDGALDTLVRYARTHPRLGIAAPRLLNPDGSVQPAAFKYPTLLMAAIDLFPLPSIVPGRLRRWWYDSGLNGRYPRDERNSQPFRIDHPLGACFLLRREAYEQCGGFDEKIFMYSEEIDLAYRYSLAGWECWQVPASRVMHVGGRSTAQMPERMFVELWRSRLYIFSKYDPRWQQIALRTLLGIAMIKDVVVGTIVRGIRGRRTRAGSRARRARAVLRMMKQS